MVVYARKAVIQQITHRFQTLRTQLIKDDQVQHLHLHLLQQHLPLEINVPLHHQANAVQTATSVIGHGLLMIQPNGPQLTLTADATMDKNQDSYSDKIK